MNTNQPSVMKSKGNRLTELKLSDYFFPIHFSPANEPNNGSTIRVKEGTRLFTIRHSFDSNGGGYQGL